MATITENRFVQRIAATLGVVGSVALGFFYVLVPMLIVPYPAVYGFWVAWGALVILSLYWWRPHPWRTLLVPIAGFVAVFAAISLGEAIFGWTA